jgi:hypothetical protein
MAIPELADQLSGWREISALASYLYAEPLLREAGALSQIGSYRAVGGCRKVRLKLRKSKELTRIRSEAGTSPSARHTGYCDKT